MYDYIKWYDSFGILEFCVGKDCLLEASEWIDRACDYPDIYRNHFAMMDKVLFAPEQLEWIDCTNIYSYRKSIVDFFLDKLLILT